MNRDLEKLSLPAWKDSGDRKPLLIRGARQVGKTYTVRSFAKEGFQNLVEINFELRPDLKKIFQTLDPHEIIRNIHLILNQRIEPGKTLLFLDEIQECPQAIMSLRYFYEILPALHVVGAGSLLEFALSEKGFKMPVGRVQYLYMQPFSFTEFLLALGAGKLKKHIEEISIEKPPSEASHEALLKRLKEYLLLGGMPAVLKAYMREKTAYQQEQLSLLQTYRDDFGKYASRARHVHLQKVFSTAPAMVGRRYKYSHVDPDTQSRELKEAFFLLSQAGVLYKIVAASAHGLSLQTNEAKFKVLFLDVGLMQRGCSLDAEIATVEDILLVNSGALAEQFVGQELLASLSPYEDRRLFFWVRDRRNAEAEIDYLVTDRSRILPIEVKSGKSGTLKSLRIFMAEHGTPVGVRVSQHPLSLHDRILSVPLYAASQIPRLVNEADLFSKR